MTSSRVVHSQVFQAQAGKAAPLPTHRNQGDGQKVVKNSAWKTRNQKGLPVPVATCESGKSYCQVGNDGDGENVETTAHDRGTSGMATDFLHRQYRPAPWVGRGHKSIIWKKLVDHDPGIVVIRLIPASQ